MTTTDMTIIPDIRVVRLDETEYWDESITSRAGKLWGVYLFDANRHVYACEMTPSFELHRQGVTYERSPEDEIESDRLNTDVIEGDAYSEPVSYIHTHQINLAECEKMDELTPKSWAELLSDHGGDSEAALDEVLDGIGEYVRSNGYVY